MVNIITRDYDKTKGIELAFQEKLGFVRKFTDEDINVTLSREGDQHKINFRTVYNNKNILLIEVNEDLYAGLDILKDRIKNELSKQKEIKELEDRRSSKSLKEMSNILAEKRKNKINEKEDSIIKRKVFHLKPMMEEEAILQMEMLKHSFFVYLDAETNQTAVIYKRKDGKYGSIETKLA